MGVRPRFLKPTPIIYLVLEKKNDLFIYLNEQNVYLGDNCIQKFSFGEVYRPIYCRKFSLRRRISGAVKHDFRTYIRWYTSPNENFEYGYPHSNALLNFPFKTTTKMYFIAPFRPAAASCIKPLASCIYSLANQWKATLRNDVGFPTVYYRIYCRKFMTLSNQTSCCFCKCIRIIHILFFDFYIPSLLSVNTVYK